MKVSFNEKSWHRKLQLKFYGEDFALMGSLCPYFWLTVLAVVLIIPKLIIVGLYKVFVTCIYKPLLKISATRHLDWLDNLTEDVLFECYRYARKSTSYKAMDKFHEALNHFCQKFGVDRNNIFNKIYARYSEWERAEYSRKERSKTENKKRIATFVKAGKTIGLMAAGAATYGLVKFLIWLSQTYTFNQDLFLKIMGCIFIALLILVAILGIVSFIGEQDLKNTTLAQKIQGAGLAVKDKIGKFANTVFDFIVAVVKVIKEDYCPVIEWKK